MTFLNKTAEKTKDWASLPRNIRTVFSAMGKRFPKSRWQIPLYMAFRIAAPFMTTLIPSLAIRMITGGSASYFLIIMALCLSLYWIRQAAENIAMMYLNYERNYTAKDIFFTNFIKKALTTDYLNVEPPPKQKMIQEAEDAIYFSQTLLSETTEFIITFFGMLFYGTAVLTLDIRILLLTLVLFIFDFVLRNSATKYDNIHWGEHIDVLHRRNYLKRSSLDISAGKDIRIYQLNKCFYTHFDELIDKEADFQKRRSWRWFYPPLSGGIFTMLRDILAYGILIGKVLDGELDAAGFTLYLGVISGLTNWTYSFVHAFCNTHYANRRFQSYFTFMDLPDNYLHGSHKTEEKKGEAAPNIEFRDVSFSYENSDTPVLSHLNFTLHSGEKIALVGNNGAGKTTLVKLLCGLYPVTKGEILIDGQPLKTLDLDLWQDKISAIFQDAVPMAFSIAMNVAGRSKEETDIKRVRESLMRAGLLEKVNALKNKEETYFSQQLNENGIMLSGGEMQRLLFARAIYKDGSVLILDEPTAALDPIAESEMYEEYNALAEKKTSLFISHRLASTKFCDRILFLEDGQITEMGTHAQLMQKNGKYKEMFEIQSHYYKNGEEEAR